MRPDFTPSDIEQARRINRKLDKLPRFRMQTAFGRLVLNLLLRVFELYPLMRGVPSNVQRELRSVECNGRRVKVRIFRPAAPSRGIVVDVHGGGWTIGNARMSDDENARLADTIAATVVSIDYRLALAEPISSLVDDCEAALLWMIQHSEGDLGGGKLVLTGSSAGAHLAALALLRLRDRHALSHEIAGAVFLFGLYDFSGTHMVRTADPRTLVLHAPTVRETLCQLTPNMSDEERRDPAISPLYADLRDLPPALFIVGDKDMLLEDSQSMEARWNAGSDNAEFLLVPEGPHAFNRLRTAISSKVERFTSSWILQRLKAEA